MRVIQNKIVKRPYFSTVCLLLVTSLGCINCTNTTVKKKGASENITAEDDDREYTDYMYQYSLIDALLSGVYDGDLSVGELRTKGSLSVGGFNHLDGELYMDKGEVYKIRYDGSVRKIPDADKVPIAFVKHFQPDTTLTLVQKDMGYEEFKTRLQSFLNENELYAIRISGTFPKVLARAPAPAEKPYPPLAEHLKEHQHGFGLKQTRGAGVGFYLPAYMGKMNIPGFHFHYLSREKTSGGHVLDFLADSLYVEIDKASGVIMQVPDNKSFRRAGLQKDREKEVEEIE